MIITNSPLRRYVNPSASFVDPYSKTESLLMAFCNRAFGSEIMTCHQETTHSFTPGGGAVHVAGPTTLGNRHWFSMLFNAVHVVAKTNIEERQKRQ